MEPIGTLQIIFRHNLWANIRLFEHCQELTDKQLDASIKGVFGTIRNTLLHIVRAEQSYYSRISTGKMYKHPVEAPPMKVSEMIEVLKTTGKGFIEWVTKVQENDTVEIDWNGKLRDVPKTIILNQVINHATEHRSQIMSIMTQIGIEPPDVSSWTYFEEMDRKS